MGAGKHQKVDWVYNREFSISKHFGSLSYKVTKQCRAKLMSSRNQSIQAERTKVFKSLIEN